MKVFVSHERAIDAIAMVAPRSVDVNLWLFVGSRDQFANAAAQSKIWNHEIRLCAEATFSVCGAVFVAEDNHAIGKKAAGLLHYFFQRDGAQATVFEYDKFEGNFKARRWEQIEARIR